MPLAYLERCPRKSAMPPQTLEQSEEITFFIIEGTHRLAAISLNDYGFLVSARMARTYIDRAARVIELKRGFDRAFFNEVSQLKSTAQAIGRDYAQFERFCTDCEKFDRLKTENWREWVSKCAVRAWSRGYRGTVSHLLAHKIRSFHSRLCSVLTEV